MKKKILILFLILLISFSVLFSCFYFLKENNFKKESENRYNIASAFIEEALIEQNRPISLKPEKTISPEGKEVYISSWNSGDMTFYLLFDYDENNIPLLKLSTTLNGTINDFNEGIASSMAGDFFKIDGNSWVCKRSDTYEICESTWKDEIYKRCTGIENIIFNNKIVLYSYKIPSGNINYSQEGCELIK
jgi:hypothetical protein